ncbi:type II toxin-antitoxin system VapC family toxin [Xylophilus sp. GOD-11R]|uniref:type II toxin-antitoxin system VapC family toxin n=1 Tax=Xylophilus sp. GOD-11R TaxID=3089814 RepID=UPI00298CD01C|nr:PIN domain-containing protein [Xylophilus sp. GOD-11R]WPB59064.1 VapC toxin family PIN domain ribonuclease [Xylophilus sp. GOD-11R]
MSVLADTSVWIAHFREPSPELIGHLDAGQVLIHPMVIAELACGTPPDRLRTLQALGLLEHSHQASMAEVLLLIEGKKLFGRGCGLVDMMLLASTLVTPGATLWTLDKRLADLADLVKVRYRPSLH